MDLIFRVEIALFYIVLHCFSTLQSAPTQKDFHLAHNMDNTVHKQIFM